MAFDKLQNPLCLFSLLVYSIAINVPKVYGENKGETLFKQVCAACHTKVGGKLVGPDLKGIYQKRSEGWIIPWIRNSQESLLKWTGVETDYHFYIKKHWEENIFPLQQTESSVYLPKLGS